MMPFQANNVDEIESYFANPIWKKDDIIGSIISSPLICDLDNNTNMEIIILSDRGLVYILDHLGNYLMNWGDPFPKAIDE